MSAEVIDFPVPPDADARLAWLQKRFRRARQRAIAGRASAQVAYALWAAQDALEAAEALIEQINGGAAGSA